MKKAIILLLMLFATAIYSTAQKIDNTVSFRNIVGERYFRFNYDNDFFTAKDQNYTQGYSFELVSPFFKKNPINYLFIRPKGSDLKYGLAWEHIGFTPSNIRSPEIQFGDRPFASALMLKSFIVANVSQTKSRLSSALSLGVIGPIASGQWLQTEIHKATDNIIPQGWPNQVQDHIVANYEINYEKKLFASRDFFSLQSSSTVRLGTLFTDASLGASAMIGLFNSPLEKEHKRKFQFYLYTQPLVSFVAHDATLQGSVLNKKKSVYLIQSDKVARTRGHLNYGLVMKVGGMYFEYSQAFQSKDFEGATYYRWGSVKAGFNF